MLGAQQLPALLIATDIAGAGVLIIAGRHFRRRAVDVLALGFALAGVTIAALLVAATAGGRVVDWVGGWRPRPGLTVGIVLVVDRVGATAVLLLTVLLGCALLFGWRYFDDVHAHYPALLLLFSAGLAGFLLTGDLFDMFVFFELMGAAGYALAGFKIEEPQSVQGGLTFAVLNSLGAYLGLVGIALVYARTGALGLAQIGTALAGKGTDPLLLTSFTLIVTGWLVKAAVLPFHFWLADAHAVAPTPVCVLFSGIMAPSGVYAVGRVYWVAFHGVLPDGAVHRALLVLGAATATLGALMCFTQRHIKRLLAYSTIAHIGLFVLGVAALNAAGVAGSAVYLLGHAGAKGALFLLTGMLLAQHRSVDEFELHGRASGQRLAGALFVIGALALAGLPPFGTALGKALVEDAGGSVALTVLVVAVSSVTGAAALRVALRVYFGVGPHPDERLAGETVSGRGEQPDFVAPQATPVTMTASVLVLLCVALAAGVLPAIGFGDGDAAAAFVDQRGYLDVVLHASAAPSTGVPDAGWTGSGVALGLVSAGLAVLIAIVALHASRLPRRVRAIAWRTRPALTALHRLHSGHVGDYAAWLVLGCAVLAGLLAAG